MQYNMDSDQSSGVVMLDLNQCGSWSGGSFKASWSGNRLILKDHIEFWKSYTHMVGLLGLIE